MQDPNKSFFDEEREAETEKTPTPEPATDTAEGEDGVVRIPHTAPDEGPKRNNGESLATISLVLALASVFCCGFPASIAAIITALLSRRQLGKFNASSLAGFVIGIVSIVFLAFVSILLGVISVLIEDAIGDVTGSALSFLPFLR